MLTRFVLAIYIGRMGKRSVKSVNISEAVALFPPQSLRDKPYLINAL